MTRQTMVAILTLCVLALPTLSPVLAQQGATVGKAPGGSSEETAQTAQETPAKSRPKALLTVPLKDFGVVPKGTRVRYDYEIKNTGDADLEIVKVAPACGCTVASYDKVIKPGETGTVHAEIDTNVLGARSHRYINVYTNDPDSPVLQLQFDMTVKPHLEIHPGYARYQVVHGETEPGILREWVYSVDGADFNVTGVDSPVPYLKTSYHRATADERRSDLNVSSPDGPQWIVELNLDYNRAPIGALAYEVVIHTDHKLQDRLLLPVSGFVRPPMWATPNEVHLGQVPLGQSIHFSVVVQSFLADPLEITGVKFDGKDVESSISPNQDGRKYTVRITLEPPQTAGPIRGRIQIHTSYTQKPVLEVPVDGTVASRG